MRLPILLLACCLVSVRAMRGGRNRDDTVVFHEERDARGREGAQRGRLHKVYEWKQLTYNIDGQEVLTDRFGDDLNAARRRRRQTEDRITFRENDTSANDFQNNVADARKFFIQYNNVPMGVERWRNKLFVTVPRRRYGIPSTLNYLDLDVDTARSPGLRPYPSLRAGRSLVSVYRTRADDCDRLWMVDTGLLEIPNARVQRQPPAIVIFDLHTDRQLRRYPLKETDMVNERTPAGLASIVVDMEPGKCDTAHAYITDLATYGVIVYSLKDNDSWRVAHNFFSFSPVAGALNIAGQQFNWNDGIFSITLGERMSDGFRRAYFHPMVSFQEFSVSTRVLRDRDLAGRDFHGDDFKLEGERGAMSQSTVHARHAGSDAILFAEVGRDAISCWNTRRPLTPENKVTLLQDHRELIYPSDLHITGDEVWVMANTMPRFIYARLNPNEFNFHIYRGNINELIAGTACAPPLPPASRPSYGGSG